ncbi:MAG: 16S rRNA (guanine1207-N2)-methyltransferase [Bacillota bacterium]|nr:MAG: 16S rRNA (guanine1207-N2)-methyltransferase [Bacillota bacterium]MBS3950109.1 class I SAM-dependent methyltransferase [Peptococcaceae bacterium]
MEMTRPSKFFLDSFQTTLRGNLLDYGSRNAEIALTLECSFADHRISNTSSGVQAHYVSRVQELPETYHAIILTAQFSTALNMQLVRELLSVLVPGRKLYVLLERGYTVTPFDELMIPYTVDESLVGEKILTFTRWDGPIDADERPVRYTLEAGDKTLTLQAGAGVFSSDALDAGTKALLDVVQWHSGRVLDLGCGNGVVGLYAHAKGATAVTMIDSDLRALRWARENAERNHSRVQIVSSDGLKELEGSQQFDMILSNPPYNSDYSVAKGFIEDGYKALAMGGSIWLVVKNSDWYRNKMKTVFGGSRVIEQDGYAIITAEKREVLRKPVKEIKTTRKHEKRMASSKKYK